MHLKRPMLAAHSFIQSFTAHGQVTAAVEYEHSAAIRICRTFSAVLHLCRRALLQRSPRHSATQCSVSTVYCAKYTIGEGNKA